MPAHDPADEEEYQAHVKAVNDRLPDYHMAWKKKPPPYTRPHFPKVLPPLSTMTGEELAEMQVHYCMNEVDFIKNPNYVREFLDKTEVHSMTLHQVVRYAWDRLEEQQHDVYIAERLLDRLELRGCERGYGRKGEVFVKPAEHVGDEKWLATATHAEMRRETELAATQRSEMELSEDCLLQTAQLEMDDNEYWGNGPFDCHARPSPKTLLWNADNTPTRAPRNNNNNLVNGAARHEWSRGKRFNGKHEGTGHGGPSNRDGRRDNPTTPETTKKCPTGVGPITILKRGDKGDGLSNCNKAMDSDNWRENRRDDDGKGDAITNGNGAGHGSSDSSLDDWASIR